VGASSPSRQARGWRTERAGRALALPCTAEREGSQTVPAPVSRLTSIPPTFPAIQL
jgi:hypothetical protein